MGPLDHDEVVDAYRQTHIFVLSSATARDGDTEGQALVLPEAQAMGLPVVSTFHNGIPDGVLDGDSGFLAPDNAPNALSENSRYLIEHPKRSAQMGQARHACACDTYDINTLRHRLLNIYNDMLSPDSHHPVAQQK